MTKLWVPQVASVALIIFGLFPGHSYSFFTLMRWVCFPTLFLIAANAYENNSVNLAWLSGIAAAMYNPILPVHLSRNIWIFIDLCTISLIATSFFNSRFREKSS